MFSVFLVACMKLLAGIVVWFVYGPYAVGQGHTTMPWFRPNLMVAAFWLAAAMLSLTLYWLGYHKFQTIQQQKRLA